MARKQPQGPDFSNVSPEDIINHFANTMRKVNEEGLFGKRLREWAEEDAKQQATKAAAKQQPTGYSRDPAKCKHQFANGRTVCPYCQAKRS